MFINLNDEKTNCIVEKVYPLRTDDLYRTLTFTGPDIPKDYDRDIIYRDKAGNQHCILAFAETPFARSADIALIYALKKSGEVRVAWLSAADFSVDSGQIELDQLNIKLQAITGFLLERRKLIPKDIDCIVRYSELNHLFAVDFGNNKDLALIVGEMLNRHNPKIYTDMEPGSISIIIDSDTEGA